MWVMWPSPDMSWNPPKKAAPSTLVETTGMGWEQHVSMPDLHVLVVNTVCKRLGEAHAK